MTLNICLAGATGWAGSELARGIAASSDLAMTAGTSRSQAGRSLAEALNEPRLGGMLHATAREALQQARCDVFVEYAGHETAKQNILLALDSGAHVVVGSSGLSDADYAEIDARAQAQQRGVLACGNFAMTAVLLQKFATLAARYLPHWEIVEYASATKVDVPSGTVRELALRMAEVRAAQVTVPIGDIHGPREARGATVSGTQVHAVRLPGHTLGVDVVFGAADETLVLRHNSGSSARPYVDGALLAIRQVHRLVGVHRGLDKVLDLG